MQVLGMGQCIVALLNFWRLATAETSGMKRAQLGPEKTKWGSHVQVRKNAIPPFRPHRDPKRQ
jgi:hypothetical protein